MPNPEKSPQASVAFPLIAAGAKAQIGKLETCFQNQVQKYEAEKMSYIEQHKSMKAQLQKEKKQNKKLQRTIQTLQAKLLEAQNSNKNILELLQNLKKETQSTLDELIIMMQQRVLDAASTAKLVQQLNQVKKEHPVSTNRNRSSRRTLNSVKNKQTKHDSSEYSEGDNEDGGDDVREIDDEEFSDEERDGNKSDSSQLSDVPENYQSGNFVLYKSNVEWDGDTVVSKLDELNLFKIEGKALLQKYIPFESNGKIIHKSTWVYTRWNVHNRENYYSITEILDLNPCTNTAEECVGLDLNDLIKVRDK